MERELTEVYCGSGKGKTALAMGQSLRVSAEGKSVIIIQFLKGNEHRELDFLETLDQLDIKIFRFEKMENCYDELTDEEKAEEKRNIINGLNFARKVVATHECDLLVLDEVLGLFDNCITTPEMIQEILQLKADSMHIILTGRVLPKELESCVDSITTINTQRIR